MKRKGIIKQLVSLCVLVCIMLTSVMVISAREPLPEPVHTIKAKGVSKYKICRACNLQQTQLNAYCNNKMSRIDLDVLTRICDYLECDLTDILKYYPPEKEKSKDER